MKVPEVRRLVSRSLASTAAVLVMATAAVAQDARNIPANQVPAALYCGNLTATIYTQNAGNPATEFRAADYNVGEVGQRYLIDPGINGAIEAAWYVVSSSPQNLGLLQRIEVAPFESNNRLLALELLAIPDVGPGRFEIEIHLACRPAG